MSSADGSSDDDSKTTTNTLTSQTLLPLPEIAVDSPPPSPSTKDLVVPSSSLIPFTIASTSKTSDVVVVVTCAEPSVDDVSRTKDECTSLLSQSSAATEGCISSGEELDANESSRKRRRYTSEPSKPVETMRERRRRHTSSEQQKEINARRRVMNRRNALSADDIGLESLREFQQNPDFALTFELGSLGNLGSINPE